MYLKHIWQSRAKMNNFILQNQIRAPRGERNRHAKLTWEDIHKIRYDYEHQIKTRKELQNQYSCVTPTTINNILAYKTWKE